MNFPWHQYLMASIYVFVGIFHWLKPKAFMRIMPRYLPAHRTLVYLSGIAEITLGIAVCFPSTSTYAAWGIMLMLLVFFPVHIYMIGNEKASLGLPKWVLYGRLLLQFGLIWWAFIYT
ncbi:hypothetical protein GWK08_02355 [Leptobacterium flavescens]|uniref:Methylamine utilisation protein MauE domain-containing protein n=1 Tax=Leptobacterium flavescens TaxID=472055 RepID=A0A6P0UMM3_9FLAO|nr:MauE/DoxX family redox-associated membrane protein [Leptobacterium flavescens]NER12273.1 hypothetical protein [Leptobacterium flavescens]